MRALAQLALISSVLSLFIFPFVQSARLREDHAVEDEYSATLNAEFPIDQKPGGYIGYRYSHAPVPGDLENSFLISTESLGTEKTLSANLRVADTTSIFEQMTALHRAQPKKPLRELRNNLKIRVSHMTEADCPAVRSQFDEFKKLTFPAPRFDFISIDIPDHEFRIISSTGVMTFEWLDESHPLVLWAQKTRHALDSCNSDRPPTAIPRN